MAQSNKGGHGSEKDRQRSQSGRSQQSGNMSRQGGDVGGGDDITRQPEQENTGGRQSNMGEQKYRQGNANRGRQGSQGNQGGESRRDSSSSGHQRGLSGREDDR
jgi:hypothetical protein